MAAKIDDLLKVATSHGASDLHLKVGAFPVMRIGGELHPVGEAARLKQEDTLDMAFAMMSNRQKQRFKEASEVSKPPRSTHTQPSAPIHFVPPRMS